MQTAKLIRRFAEVFGAGPKLLAQAPGRVNLIGEHVDYNDGLVLPMAIDNKVLAAGRLTSDGGLSIYSLDFKASYKTGLTDARPTGEWSDYPLGVVLELARRDLQVPGLEIALTGDVPLGAGLSSSAAVEVAVATLVNALTDGGLSPLELALAAQRAENEFVGTRCGIMDQATSALGREGHLLLLDCRDLSFEQVPFDQDEFDVVIFDTKVKRRLAASAYNDRRADCERAAVALKQRFNQVNSLRDVTIDQLESCRDDLDRNALNRARHVIEEIARVRQVAELLAAGKIVEVGDLMNRSHQSLRDLFEVSCPELETAFNEGSAIEGVLGGRLTGAGFGGCCVFLVRSRATSHFTEQITARYHKATGIQPEVLVSKPAAGAQVLAVSL